MSICSHTGNPSIEKCKKVRIKREEDQEMADIDVTNIIVTKGKDLSHFFIVGMECCVLFHNGGKQWLLRT